LLGFEKKKNTKRDIDPPEDGGDKRHLSNQFSISLRTSGLRLAQQLESLENQKKGGWGGGVDKRTCNDQTRLHEIYAREVRVGNIRQILYGQGGDKTLSGCLKGEGGG